MFGRNIFENMGSRERKEIKDLVLKIVGTILRCFLYIAFHVTAP